MGNNWHEDTLEGAEKYIAAHDSEPRRMTIELYSVDLNETTWFEILNVRLITNEKGFHRLRIMPTNNADDEMEFCIGSGNTAVLWSSFGHVLRKFS
jgi:hypothetical protein